MLSVFIVVSSAEHYSVNNICLPKYLHLEEREMLRQKTSQLALLLLLSLLTYAFNIQSASASGTIYIRANGSIDPPTAPIQRNVDVYTFTNDITGSIIVEKDNIVVDGACHTLQGTGSETGIDLSGRTNVTIQNAEIKTFDSAIYLSSSSHITILGTTISDSSDGIWISDSSSNSISQNNITANVLEGIYILVSSDNSISGNNIIANIFDGIYLYSSSNNIISMNNIENNGYGISPYYSSDNRIFHNNFINNTSQVNPNTPTDVWDDGYPSGGNYWSDYTGVDEKSGPNQNLPGSDGIGDTPYGIDENNQDRYPLMKTHNIGIQNVTTSKTVVGQGYKVGINAKITNYGANSETFNITVYVNTTSISTQTLTLRSISSTTVAFTWNTSGFAKGNYTINAYIEPVSGEIDTMDNAFTNGWVIVAMIGDIAGPLGNVPDGKVDMRDIAKVARRFGADLWHPLWDSNCDTTGSIIGVPDNKIDMRDIAIVAKQFGKTDP